MERELIALRKELADTRPIGARLDSARAKVNKLEAKLTAAEAAVETAQARREEASLTLAVARAEFKELQQLSAAVPSAPADVSDVSNVTAHARGSMKLLPIPPVKAHVFVVIQVSTLVNDLMVALIRISKSIRTTAIVRWLLITRPDLRQHSSRSHGGVVM